jgi:hypothetical protein
LAEWKVLQGLKKVRESELKEAITHMTFIEDLSKKMALKTSQQKL